MIKQFIGKLLGKPGTSGKQRFGKRVEVGPEVHRIDLALVDPRAINVVATLKQEIGRAHV